MRVGILVFVMASAAACSKSDKAAKGEPAAAAPVAAAPVAAEPAAPAPAAAAAPGPAKSEYKPDELWTAVEGLDRMALMEKFVDGITVTGTIAKITDDPTGEYELELDAGAGHIVAVHFGDNGLAFKKSNPKVGGQVVATKCNVTVPQGNKISLAICEAK